MVVYHGDNFGFLHIITGYAAGKIYFFDLVSTSIGRARVNLEGSLVYSIMVERIDWKMHMIM